MTETTEQPLPTRNGHPSIQSLVRADLDTREQVGRERYGSSLQPWNGRDGLRDLYEELLDACCYVRQRIAESETEPQAWQRVAEVEAANGELRRQLETAREQIDWLRREIPED